MATQPPLTPRLLVVVTHPMTARYLLRGQLGYLATKGFVLGLATAPGPDLEFVARTEKIAVYPVPFTRDPNPALDLRALRHLSQVIADFRPNLVNASTPKAGLLGMVAAAWHRVSRRVYQLRGLRWETLTGLRRATVRWADGLACRLAHQVVCVSPSLHQRAREGGVVPEGKGIVLGHGSSNGVDVHRFCPPSEDQRVQARRRLGLDPRARVLGFVGRLARDKGVADLWRAFVQVVLPAVPDAALLLVGSVEENDPLPPAVLRELSRHPQVRWVGFLEDPITAYHAMDLLVFPSRREGFPNAPLEAAACAVPTVGYAATGTVDAVVDGVTGRLVPVGAWQALGEAVVACLGQPDLTHRLGQAARQRAVAQFAQEKVWQLWEGFYRQQLQGLPDAP